MTSAPIEFAASPVEERFLSKVRAADSGCWEWQGYKQRGYGSFKCDGRPQPAHRVMFKWFYGEDSLAGLHVDHLCRNRSCVNPLHLEAVTQAENNRRAHLGRPKPPKSHCTHGHAITGDNAGVRSDGKGLYCRTCSRAASARYSQRRQG